MQSHPLRRLAVSLVLVLFLFLSFSPSFRNTPLFLFSQKITFEGMFLLSWLSDRVRTGFAIGVAHVHTQQGLLEERDRLVLRLGEVEARLQTFDALTAENERLKEGLRFLEHSPYRFHLLPAQVISRSPSRWFELVTIDRGSGNGLMVGMPVVHPQGLAGRIVQVNEPVAQVLLLTDLRSSVSVMNARTGELAVVKGQRMPWLKMDYVLTDSPIATGDLVVTSQNSAYFPRGLMVGMVTKVTRHPEHLFAEVQVQPAVPYASLSTLFVWKR